MSYEYKVGRVGTTPELKVTSGGRELAEFRLAVDGKYDPATKSRPTEWFTVTAWEPMSQVVAANFHPGSRVWVSGDVTIFHAASGDRPQIKASELGTADKLIPTAAGSTPAKAAKVPSGVTFDEEDAAEW